MIKATSKMKDGRPMVLLGLTGENIARLMADEPVSVDLGQLGLPPVQVVLMYGKTETDIAKQLQPMFGPDTTFRHD